jgi:hypothetical protein
VRCMCARCMLLEVGLVSAQRRAIGQSSQAESCLVSSRDMSRDMSHSVSRDMFYGLSRHVSHGLSHGMSLVCSMPYVMACLMACSNRFRRVTAACVTLAKAGKGWAGVQQLAYTCACTA